MNLLKTLKCTTIILALFCLAHCQKSDAESPALNQAAPAFSGKNTKNETVNLSDFKGKTVVLEWTNHECPYVEKHYDSNNMQNLQKKHTQDGGVWLTIISSAENKQGHLSPQKADALTQSRQAAPSMIILDSDGNIGKSYGAQTTPHMYVIDPDGILVYKGAIDSIRSTKTADIEKATNYVDQALTELKEGKKISVPQTKAYGCSIKY